MSDAASLPSSHPGTRRRSVSPPNHGALDFVPVLLLLIGFVLPLARRSINLADEGYILLQSLDMLQGRVLYRDMDAFVSPGIWFLLSALFSIVEPSVLASRALSVAAYGTTVVTAFRIVSVLANRFWGYLCTLLFAIFVVWAFPVWTFTFYSPFAVLFSLIGLERLLAWRQTRNRWPLVFAGVGFGLAIVFKQNYGAFAALGGTLGLFAIHFEVRDGPRSGILREFGIFVSGGIVTALPLIPYFLYHGALDDVFQSLVVHPFVFAGQHSIEYLGPSALVEPNLLAGVDRLTYGAYSLYNSAVPTQWLKQTRLIERLHVLLYLFPILAFAGAALYSAGSADKERRYDGGLLAALAVCGMLFLGVFPRADYNHLINLYQPILVIGVVVAARLSRAGGGRRPPWLWGLGAFAGILVTCYAAVAAYWYVTHLTYMNTELTTPRGGVYLRKEKAMRLNALIDLAQNATQPGDALLSVPDLSMINFLSSRDVPSAYYNLYQHHIAHDEGAGVVAGSEARNVTTALTRYSDFFSDRVRLRDYAPRLVEYLAQDFRIEFSVGGDNFLFLRQLATPRPQERELRLLDACRDGIVARKGDHQIRPHLLFTTLYQDRGRHHKRRGVAIETPCTLQLPDDAREMQVRIGFRPPLVAESGAFLVTDVIVTHDGESETLLQQRHPILPSSRLPMNRRWPEAITADVSHLAGREVTFHFRTQRRGWVKSDPASFKGYATMWIEPRIVLGSIEGASDDSDPH